MARIEFGVLGIVGGGTLQSLPQDQSTFPWTRWGWLDGQTSHT